jgi:hypothetical protein
MTPAQCGTHNVHVCPSHSDSCTKHIRCLRHLSTPFVPIPHHTFFPTNSHKFDTHTGQDQNDQDQIKTLL